ncbi:hypothetical protein [Herbaspirillum camelliae]|uniref:hypothetical protein n=1 Tax=Herbaspirillum camelliae TaxID=1892903 RepID=UPI00117AEED2|nr:hypothetical protein [Herbaspirillum camelliae]
MPAKILESAFDLSEHRLKRQLAEHPIEWIGVAVCVQKVLWSGKNEDIPLAIAMDQVIPWFESLVQEHPAILLN